MPLKRKKLYLPFFVLCFLLQVCSFAQTSTDTLKTRLIGKWALTGHVSDRALIPPDEFCIYSINTVLRFKPDNTYTFTAINKFSSTYREGKWKIAAGGNTITLYDNYELIEKQKQDCPSLFLTIIRLSKKELVLSEYLCSDVTTGASTYKRK